MHGIPNFRLVEKKLFWDRILKALVMLFQNLVSEFDLHHSPKSYSVSKSNEISPKFRFFWISHWGNVEEILLNKSQISIPKPKNLSKNLFVPMKLAQNASEWYVISFKTLNRKNLGRFWLFVWILSKIQVFVAEIQVLPRENLNFR